MSTPTLIETEAEAADMGAEMGAMHALVYHGPGAMAWETKPMPVILEASDAIVRITTSTICGTDLHIAKGDMPEVADGRILGHEGVGVVVEAGAGVARFREGDRVLISCITSCGQCGFCRKALYSRCSRGGWILGHTIDGTQAEYVRIPHADSSLYAVPKGVDEEAMVMLSDVLPSGFECGVFKGRLKPGDRVAVVGSGPVGLAAVLTARLYSPQEILFIDTDPSRLETALSFGATKTFDNRDGKAAQKVLDATGVLGVDVAIEAAGFPETLELCKGIIADGGHIAHVGAHCGPPATLATEKFPDRKVTVSTDRVDTSGIPVLVKVLAAGLRDAKKTGRHRCALGQVVEAYGIFGHANRERALKVILKG
jgi:alcohol dehydrogenase